MTVDWPGLGHSWLLPVAEPYASYLRRGVKTADVRVGRWGVQGGVESAAGFQCGDRLWLYAGAPTSAVFGCAAAREVWRFEPGAAVPWELRRGLVVTREAWGRFFAGKRLTVVSLSPVRWVPAIALSALRARGLTVRGRTLLDREDDEWLRSEVDHLFQAVRDARSMTPRSRTALAVALGDVRRHDRGEGQDSDAVRLAIQALRIA